MSSYYAKNYTNTKNQPMKNNAKVSKKYESFEGSPKQVIYKKIQTTENYFNSIKLFNEKVANCILEELKNFSSGLLQNNYNNPELNIEFNETEIKAHVLLLPKCIKSDSSSYMKLTEMILHGDLQERNEYIRIHYGYDENIIYCQPLNENNDELKSLRTLNGPRQIFNYFQTFIYNELKLYVYDASKIITRERYKHIAHEQENFYVGILDFCKETIPAVVFSKTPLTLSEDSVESQYFLWFEQPDETLECPEEYTEYFNELLRIINPKKESKKMVQKISKEQKILLTYIEKTLKNESSEIIHETVYYGDLNSLDSNVINKLEEKYDIKFNIENEKSFRIVKNSDLKTNEKIIDFQHVKELEEEEKLKLIEQMNEEMNEEYNDTQSINEETETDENCIFPKILFDNITNAEYEIQEINAFECIAGEKIYILIGDIAYYKPIEGEFNEVNDENIDFLTDKNLKIRRGKITKVYKISSFILTFFESPFGDYYVDENGKAYLCDHNSIKGI